MSHERREDEPTQTILVGMAKRWLELGNKQQAEVCLQDGHAEALAREDSDTLKEIEEIRRRGR